MQQGQLLQQNMVFFIITHIYINENGLCYIHMDKTTQFTKKVCKELKILYVMNHIFYKISHKIKFKKCVILIFIFGVGGQIYKE